MKVRMIRNAAFVVLVMIGLFSTPRSVKASPLFDCLNESEYDVSSHSYTLGFCLKDCAALASDCDNICWWQQQCMFSHLNCGPDEGWADWAECVCDT